MPIRAERTFLSECSQGVEVATTIFEAIADPVFIIELTEDGLAPNFSYVNEATCRLLGFSREELVGMRPGTVDELDPVAMEMAYEQLITLGQATFETRLVAADGKRIPVEIHAGVAPIAGRRCCVAVARSLAARKEMETRIRESAEEAAAANRAKSEFIAMMSHEIRTPLHGVIGFASLLEGGDELPGPVREALDGIRDSANLLLALVSDILDFSRIETGSLTLQEAAVDLPALMHRVQTAFKLRAEQKGLAFHYREDAAVPPVVVTDALRIEQIVGNLLSNALKFTEKGAITLELCAAQDGRRISFVVSDTGIGITPGQLTRLFQPFSQADPQVFQKYGGSGLGLVIIKRLCELMGGSVAVRSAPGEGSVFSASIVAGPVSGANRADAARVEASHAGMVRALRLLVAEDNPVNRKLVGRMLERLGCHAEMVPDGQAAADRMGLGGYDLVLMDVNMPVLDGIEATRLIRAREKLKSSRPVRIVALTAGISEEERKACSRAGMDDFLGKPFTLDGLQAVLERAVALSS